MTERPEERYSLAEIEKKHRQTTLRRFLVADPDAAYICARCRTPWPCDARTLINEVKERETERAMWERAAKNGSDRILDLEAALTKQYVEDANTAATLRRRVQQMEEALREVAEMSPWDEHLASVLQSRARAALSPSDTEEEAE